MKGSCHGRISINTSDKPSDNKHIGEEIECESGKCPDNAMISFVAYLNSSSLLTCIKVMSAVSARLVMVTIRSIA